MCKGPTKAVQVPVSPSLTTHCLRYWSAEVIQQTQGRIVQSRCWASRKIAKKFYPALSTGKSKHYVINPETSKQAEPICLAPSRGHAGGVLAKESLPHSGQGPEAAQKGVAQLLPDLGILACAAFPGFCSTSGETRICLKTRWFSRILTSFQT